jgi:hypothetical protein
VELTCGIEISHARALELLQDGRLSECEDCETKRMEKSKEIISLKSRETEKIKDTTMSENPPIGIEPKTGTVLRPLNIQDIIKYICPQANESEAYMFLQLVVMDAQRLKM